VTVNPGKVFSAVTGTVFSKNAARSVWYYFQLILVSLHTFFKLHTKVVVTNVYCYNMIVHYQSMLILFLVYALFSCYQVPNTKNGVLEYIKNLSYSFTGAIFYVIKFWKRQKSYLQTYI
jgi:hypothetical protein